MTPEVTEFIKQNGTFGIFVVLVVLFVWKGVPWIANWIAKRFETLHEEHGKQITEIMATHKAGMDAVVKTLETIQTDLKTMNSRMTDLELAVRRTANRRNDE